MGVFTEEKDGGDVDADNGQGHPPPLSDVLMCEESLARASSNVTGRKQADTGLVTAEYIDVSF